MGRRKRFRKRIGAGGEGAVEFSEFGFDDFRDGRDVDIPGSIEDGTMDFGLETLDALEYNWLC